MSNYPGKQENTSEQVLEPARELTPSSDTLKAALPERLDLQSQIGNARIAEVATNKLPENVAHAFPLQVGYGNAAFAHTLVQRKAIDDRSSRLLEESAPVAQATGQTGLAAPTSAPTQALIVEDTAETVEPGQMRKSQFLGELRSAVGAITNEALAGTPWTALASPYIDKSFAQYAAQTPHQLEQSIRRYAPETANVTYASGFIPLITARVHKSITTWQTTGELTGVPMGMPLALPGPGVGLVGDALSAVSDTAAGAVSSVASTLSSVGSLFFKKHGGAIGEASDPEGVQKQLGAGQTLDGGVRSRMEHAFGESFSGVQVHSDPTAAVLSDSFSARAFTVGPHIAFGAGEYQPGTMIGDALIAHELAHVMQQRGAGEGVAAQRSDGGTSGALEEDADRSAVGAVLSLWSKRVGGLAGRTLPALRSGLRLQGCVAGCDSKKEDGGKTVSDGGTKTPVATPDAGVKPKVTFPTGCKNEKELQDIVDKNPTYSEWVVETVVKGDNFEKIAVRVKDRRADLFTGRKTLYADDVEKLHPQKPIQPGQCVVLPVGWKDPNIGKLPAKPDLLGAGDPATQAIAVVYGEQTRSSAPAQEQQKYIWFSIRARIQSSRYPPDLASVLDKNQYNALGEADYEAAITDLTSGKPPAIPGVANAKKIVLDNWDSGIPADAGAGYFHWRKESTPNRRFNADKSKDEEAKEKRYAWEWATSIKIVGNVSKQDGWLKRIRGDSGGPIGSMYIYPGSGD